MTGVTLVEVAGVTLAEVAGVTLVEVAGVTCEDAMGVDRIDEDVLGKERWLCELLTAEATPPCC